MFNIITQASDVADEAKVYLKHHNKIVLEIQTLTPEVTIMLEAKMRDMVEYNIKVEV